jgi:hypothetical protein
MTNQFFIQPKTIEATATFMLIDSRVSLNKNAEFNYSLCDQLGRPLKHGLLTLTESQYAAWGNDDNYILNLICEIEEISLQTV